MSILNWRQVSLVGFLALVGCATTKSYSLKSDQPNLTVQIQMENEFFQREVAELYIYELRSKCEQFYHGFVALNEGVNTVSLPEGKELILSFVRANLSSNYSLIKEDSIHLRTQPGHQYRLRLRERNGSREVRFMSKSKGQGEFRDLEGLPMPNCETVRISE